MLVVPEWEEDALGLLGLYVSGTVVGTEDTSVDKTDTLYIHLCTV